MTRDPLLTDKVNRFAQKVGIDIIGFADPEVFDRYPQENLPEKYLQNAQTVIIVGLHLYDIILDAWSRDRQNSKSFHFMDIVIERYCHKVETFLSGEGFVSEIVSYNPGLFLKDTAALAGVGPIGRNNLLITEPYGSQVRLRALVTTAPLICGEPILESKYCKDCCRCVKACPANAFPENNYSKELCCNYAETHLTRLSQHTSIWCNACIEACPVANKAKTRT
jgi:epoxyqueuosine reductase